jgi:transposase
VRGDSLWRAVLGVDKTVIEDVCFDEDEQVLVVSVRAVARQRGRCGQCRRRCPGYDQGRAGRRRWRGLDSGTVRVFVEADSVRVECPVHGVVVAHVPWARHDAGHTHTFDAQVAWLATQTSKSAVTQLMRITWRTVGSIIARVWADVEAGVDRFEGLARIGIDEVSYRKHHHYLTVVVDHDTGQLVWAKAGRSKDTMRAFFDALGVDRSRRLTHVSCDGATWITTVVAERAPQAILCADPFHIVAWATDALDNVRREVWNIARRAPGGSRREVKGRSVPVNIAQGDARALKRARYTLWKNPENLTDRQRTKLRLDCQDPPLPTPRLPTQGRPQNRLPTHRPRRQTRPATMAAMGSALPDPRVRPTRPPHPRPPTRHPRQPRPQPVQRPDRIHQHQNPAHHPHRLRLRQPRQPHRHGHAHPRRTPPPPPRTPLNHPHTRQENLKLWVACVHSEGQPTS